jgi:LmbE family N-acetylglucosaminyl deacetylase
VAVAIAVAVIISLVPRAQMRVVPVDEEQGHVALGLALRHLANAGIFMMATAHPDDENNGLLVRLNRGQGYRTTLATATRGNGGQNEIGPEIFEALGVLRTEELAAVHRFDGAEQYFTRAVDFGFSFSIEETFEKWGRDEIVGDYVRLIRMIRPDVIVGMNPSGTGGGQHHQASAILSREAFKLSGDPTKFPEQLKEGLRPWQAKKYYSQAFLAGFGAEAQTAQKTCRVNLAVYDPLLGKTYSEIGSEARSMHKCQGTAQLLALPGPSEATYQLIESTIPGQMQRDEASLFDGIDTRVPALAQLAGTRPPKELVDGLAEISSAVETAQKKFDGDTHDATVPPLLAGLHAVRTLRTKLPTTPLDESARFDIDFRLRQKEAEFQKALLLANGVRVEVLADDGTVVPGQPVNVAVVVGNNGLADVTVRQVKFSGFESDVPCMVAALGSGRGGRGRGDAAAAPPSPPAARVRLDAPSSTLKKGMAVRCEAALKLPANARITEPYWQRDGESGRYTFDADAPFGLPFRPTPFHAEIGLGFASSGPAEAAETVIADVPIQHRYEGDNFSGEKRTDLLVVPAISVRVSPEIAIVPVSSLPALPTVARSKDGPSASVGGSSAGRNNIGRGRSSNRLDASQREVRVTVLNNQPAASEGLVTLEAPAGWSVSPPQQSVRFVRQDESQTVRFALKPAGDAALGAYHVRARVSSGGRTFDRGYQIVEYPHIRRQHIYHDAVVMMKIVNVKTAPNLTVGYIVGVGDEVPAALEQLGVKVELLSAEDLAWRDLSRFSAIVTGVRAYERRSDLRANNGWVLNYVYGGGTVIVQYNKFEFNEAYYGPYPALVSDNRVTDEFAPLNVVAPGDPLVTFPNEITSQTWRGWVQERGLYFLGDRDPRYRDIVALEDPFPNNAGEKRGALVETTYGKGHWVYVGLGLWRQLPAGTDGAYQLLANLISRGKAPAVKPSRGSAR